MNTRCESVAVAAHFDATNISANATNETEYCRVPDVPYYPLPLSVLITVIHLILLVVGTVGNVATLVIIYMNRQFRSKTNIMLCNLAISDLILLSLGVIFDLFAFWKPLQPLGGDWFCFFKAFIIETVTDVSVMTIMAIAAERWFAICRRPFELPTPVNYIRIFSLIAAIWVVAVCGALPHALQYSVVRIPCDNISSDIPLCDPALSNNYILVSDCNSSESQYGQCDVTAKHRYSYLSEILSVVFFFMPMTCIACGYGYIMWEVRSSLRIFGDIPECSSCLAATQVSDRKSLIRIIIAVVVIFFISHLPLHVQRILALNYNEEWDHCDNTMLDFMYVMFVLAAFLHFFSATSNPYLYLIFSRRFRVAFHRLLLRVGQRIFRCRLEWEESKTKTTTHRSITPISKRQRYTMKLRQRLFKGSKENDVRLSWSPRQADTPL